MCGYKAPAHPLPVFFRPSLLSILISLVLGALVFFLFWIFVPQETGESYGVLTLDEAVPDRDVGDLLIAAGFDTFYSESQTPVYYDNFGAPKSFFLDEYLISLNTGRLQAFDPRNDGYAEKLQIFFVNNGERYFFIPLEDSANIKQTEKNLQLTMGDLPYTLGILNPGRDVFIWFIFQLCAIIAALLFSRNKLQFSLIIPLILSFAWSAHSGLILSCVLIGLWELLGEPMEEFFNHNPFGNTWFRLKPYRTSIIWAILLIILYGVLIVLGKVPLLPSCLGFFALIFIQALSFIDIKKIKYKQRYFAPVSILPVPQRKRTLCISMMAFASVVFIALTLTLLFPDSFFQADNKNSSTFPYMPLASEYEEHMAYQSSFSFLPLSGNAGDYHHYFLGEDGLIAGISGVNTQWEIPVFPLEKLTGFLIDYMNKPGTIPLPNIKDWMSMVVIILACIPSPMQIGKGKVKIMKLSQMRHPGTAA